MPLDESISVWPLVGKVAFWMVLVTTVVTAVYGYLKVEVNTLTNASNLQASQRCQGEGKDLKTAKVFEYHPYRDYASILCVFKDSSENTLIVLNYRQDWETINKEKINQTRRFYWPIYL